MTDPSSLSFEDLFTRHKDRVYRLSLRLVRQAADAEDVAQRVFLRVYERLDQIRADQELTHWLYRITINLSIDLLRARRRGRGITSLDEEEDDTGLTLHDRVPDPSRSVDEQMERSERSAAIQRALIELPEKYRNVLILREFEALPYEEIASLLGVTAKVVGVRLIRAKEKLMDALRRTGQLDP